MWEAQVNFDGHTALGVEAAYLLQVVTPRVNACPVSRANDSCYLPSPTWAQAF